ncbi:sodium:solute symporter family protein [Cellvibrio sp. pealriver]|uniref:sodium:solute symporter family protein n=1 Tax=Cellvibrio sp. pealriver TaxID=1622269 RepID=UPI00066FF22C|nr:sodium:solute symporter family protein [Cellvibrio sp. pealriver]
MLVSFVVLYLLISIGIGVYAATKVHNAKDYITAGRQLPMGVVIAMVFATWFGAETVLGIPGTFVEENLGGLISDPFGASFCLMLFALVFARPLYRKNLLTLGDFYREKYSKPVEIVVSIAIALSYLGWVSAQITALGLVFHVLTDSAISMELGIILGAAIVMTYTLVGGMWSVAMTTVVQMTVIVVGLLWIAFLVSDQTGGVAPVVKHAYEAGKFEFWPSLEWAAVITFIAGFLTMGFGSIPQQDVFQRVNSAKSENIAVWGTFFGGVAYLFFAAIPLYLAYSAFMVDPEMAARVSEQDSQLVLPTFVLEHMPVYAQIIFFGALLSVIMSTASGTLLAPSVTLSENVIKELMPNGKTMSDKQFLTMMRIVVALFSVLVALYALYSLQEETSIHTMVANAYKVTLVVALVPLFAGIYWKKASNFGAASSIIAGLVVWIPLEFIMPDAVLPPHFAGFIVAAVVMVVASLLKPAKAAV